MTTHGWRFAVVSITLLTLAGCGGGSSGGGFACRLQCGGKNCGDDGCGGTCGTCAQGFACSAGSTCVAGCTRQCNGKVCGSDGCGGSCGTCGRGFACGNAGACDVDPTSQWVITVTTGKVTERDPNGDAWDFPGGLPDPFVCLTINGVAKCTSYASDTTTPLWNEAFPAATALALQTGITVGIWDKDVSSDDAICGSGMLPVRLEDFRAGTWGAECKYGGFSATVTPR